MIGVSSAMQRAAVARLLATPAVVAILASTSQGPAVFAPGQDFPDEFPRITLKPPQKLPRARGGCGVSEAWEVFLTIDCWAKGPEGSLQVGDLADAVEVALDGDIDPDGFTIQSEKDHFEGQTPSGDPDPKVHHLVLTFRYLVNR